jgi:hypothetical protein
MWRAPGMLVTAVWLSGCGAVRDKGIEAGARDRGQKTEPVRIAGREGRIVRAVDGAYIAMAPARKCAIVMLVGDTRPLVTDAARAIPEE